MALEYKSGFVVLAGRPNVGKSSLLNAILQESILPVSAKPQTTRSQQLAILTTPEAQIVFVDTPGIHEPHHKLGERMNAAALRALEDADVLLCVFNLHHPPVDEDHLVAERVSAASAKLHTVSAYNQIDLLTPSDLKRNWEAYNRLLPEAHPIGVSATRGDNLEVLVKAVVDRLPSGPQYYAETEITDAFERDIAADLIRSATLELLRHEVPHSIAVRIDEYKERGEHGAYVEATLFVERESQKGIVIGKGGSMLKEIGMLARQRIEQMSGRNIYLELRVKLLKGWRNDAQALKRLGYGAL